MMLVPKAVVHVLAAELVRALVVAFGKESVAQGIMGHMELDAVEAGLLAAQRGLGPELDDVEHLLVTHLPGYFEQSRFRGRIDARGRLGCPPATIGL